MEFRHCDVSRIHDDESRTVLRSFVFQYGPDPRRRHVEQRAVERHREADVCSLMEEFAISLCRNMSSIFSPVNENCRMSFM
jgi:hypothetical protein